MAPKYRLSDSESEVEEGAPSYEALEKALRKDVTEKYKAKDFEELTVKRVRHAVEEKLGLEHGFFRNTGGWKRKSEEVIKDQFVRLYMSFIMGDFESKLLTRECDSKEILRTSAADTETGPEPVASPSSPHPEPSQNPTNKRYKSTSAQTPRKRQKTQPPVSDEEDELAKVADDGSEEEVTRPKKRAAQVTEAVTSKKPKQPSPAAMAISDDEEEEAATAKNTTEATNDDSESEMSVVLDEEPKPKRKRKSSEGPSKKAAPRKEKKAAAKGKDEDLDPDQTEIKRLQGWLVKCGIRKMWWRELQPYETPKAKIKHLKQMLEDAGMKGRYSTDKARQIRDERELKADLEQIQQGAKKWGRGSGDEGSDGAAAPSRRAARGRRALAFLESEGEETD